MPASTLSRAGTPRSRTSPPAESPAVPDHLLPRASVVIPTTVPEPRRTAPDRSIHCWRRTTRTSRSSSSTTGTSLGGTSRRRCPTRLAGTRGRRAATGYFRGPQPGRGGGDGRLRGLHRRRRRGRRRTGSARSARGSRPTRRSRRSAGLVLPSELQTEPQLWFEEFYGGFSRSFRAETLSVGAPAWARRRCSPTPRRRFGAGCNMAFRRSTLERMGGFITTLGYGHPRQGRRGPRDVHRAGHRPARPSPSSPRRSSGTRIAAPNASSCARSATTERASPRCTPPSSSATRAPRRRSLYRLPAGLRLLAAPRAERSPSRAAELPATGARVPADRAWPSDRWPTPAALPGLGGSHRPPSPPWRRRRATVSSSAPRAADLHRHRRHARARVLGGGGPPLRGRSTSATAWPPSPR